MLFCNTLCKRPKAYIVQNFAQRKKSFVTERVQMPLGRIIRQFKTFTTKQARDLLGDKDFLLWQPRFYDHVIRNDEDYAEKWQYIDENPLKYICLK